MSKINATYSSGYYIAPDVDFRKLEEAQRREQRGKRKKAGADSADDGGADNVKRQTFAIPFDLICQHCHRRIARGSHVYTNRRATEERYLDSIRVWELEILCRFCSGKYYLRTDPATPKETGGYICAAGCKRVEGDFFSLNKQNQAAREEWEKAKADAELDPLAALEKENEAARLLEERNRQTEEEVEQQAGYDDGGLLRMLRSRPRHHADLTVRLAESDDNYDLKDSDFMKKAKAASSSMGLPPPPPPSSRSQHFDTDKDGDGEGGDGNADSAEDDGEEDADERTFREFEQDMERRWRALERQQRVQQRKQEAAVQNPSSVREDEVGRVLARYGGGTGVTGGASTSTPSSLPSAKGVAGEEARSSLVASAVVGAAPATVLQHRNKFLVEEDDDDDGGDESVAHAPQHRLPSQYCRTPPPSTAHSPSTGAVRVGQRSVAVVAVPQLAQPRPGGRAILCNLVDSDTDDDA